MTEIIRIWTYEGLSGSLFTAYVQNHFGKWSGFSPHRALFTSIRLRPERFEDSEIFSDIITNSCIRDEKGAQNSKALRKLWTKPSQNFFELINSHSVFLLKIISIQSNIFHSITLNFLKSIINFFFFFLFNWNNVSEKSIKLWVL